MDDVVVVVVVVVIVIGVVCLLYKYVFLFQSVRLFPAFGYKVNSRVTGY